MARILTPEDFRECPRGTLFAFGSASLQIESKLLILDEIIPVRDGGGGKYGGPSFWGFWAIDPAFRTGSWKNDLKAEFGEGKPLDFDPDRYWSYEDPMEVFFVYDRVDVLSLARLLAGEDWQKLRSPGAAA